MQQNLRSDKRMLCGPTTRRLLLKDSVACICVHVCICMCVFSHSSVLWNCWLS